MINLQSVDELLTLAEQQIEVSRLCGEMAVWQGICSWQAVGIRWYYLQGITSPHKPRDMDTTGCAVFVRQGAYTGH